MSIDNTDETGEQHGQTTSVTGFLPGDEDCGLERFVRNQYFHGKLMTARDMQLEQKYHADRLETLSQHATGNGAVCGLSTSVTQESADAPLEVTVDPGYALDCCGRPVLVDDTDDKSFPPDHESFPSDDADGVAVYVRLKECDTEKVPVPGSEDACREDCTYNRVTEDFEIQIDTDPPDPKPVHSVEFPNQGDLKSSDEDSGPDPSDPDLQTIARSYYKDESADGFAHTDCDQEGDPRVFLGYYAWNGTTWDLMEGEGKVPRHYVYTNDMLYAAIARHAADFGNPHDVTLATGGHENGATVRVADDGRNVSDVGFVSKDGTVAIELDGRTVDFSVERLERRAAQQAVKDAAVTFRDATERFPEANDAARAVSQLARAAADARLRLETDAEAAEERDIRKLSGEFWFNVSDGVFPDLFERMRQRETEFEEAVKSVVTDRSHRRLLWALDRLKRAVESGGILRLAAAQDDVSDAVEWLESTEREEEEEDEPQMVSVPDVVGMQRDEAREAIENEGLDPDVRTAPAEELDPDEHEEFESGAVVRQDPEAGTSVPIGSGVRVWVLETVAVPDVIGEEAPAAGTIIERAGLVPVLESELPVAIGFEDFTPMEGALPVVADQDPEPGTEVQPATEVSLFLEERPPIDRLPDDVIVDLPPDVIEEVPDDRIASLPDPVIRDLPDERIVGLPDDIYPELPPDVVSGLPDDRIAELPDDIIIDLPDDRFAGIPDEKIRAVDTGKLLEIDNRVVQAVDAETLNAVDTETLNSVAPSRLTKIDPAKLNAVDTQTLNSVDPAKINAVEASTLNAVDNATINAVDAETLNAVDTETLNAVDASTLNAVDASTLNAVDNETLNAVDSSKLNAVDNETLNAVDNATLNSVTADKLNAVEPETLNAVEPSKLNDVSTAKLTAVEPETLNAVETSTLNTVTTDKLNEVDTDTLNSVEPAKINTVDSGTLNEVDNTTLNTVTADKLNNVDNDTLNRVETSKLNQLDTTRLNTIDINTLTTSDVSTLRGINLDNLEGGDGFT